MHKCGLKIRAGIAAVIAVVSGTSCIPEDQRPTLGPKSKKARVTGKNVTRIPVQQEPSENLLPISYGVYNSGCHTAEADIEGRNTDDERDVRYTLFNVQLGPTRNKIFNIGDKVEMTIALGHFYGSSSFNKMGSQLSFYSDGNLLANAKLKKIERPDGAAIEWDSKGKIHVTQPHRKERESYRHSTLFTYDVPVQNANSVLEVVLRQPEWKQRYKNGKDVSYKTGETLVYTGQVGLGSELTTGGVFLSVHVQDQRGPEHTHPQIGGPWRYGEVSCNDKVLDTPSIGRDPIYG